MSAPTPEPRRYCNVCRHEIHPLGFHEWHCAHKCYCLMLGCVPMPPPPPDSLLGVAVPMITRRADV